MIDYTVRPPSAGDVTSIASLLVASEIAEHGTSDTSEDDVRAVWGWPRFDRERDAWAALSPSGGMVGYAWVWERRSPRREFDGDLQFRPGPESSRIGAELLPRMEARVKEIAAGVPGDHPALAIGCASTNAPKRELLQSHGFTAVRTFYRMERDLEGDIASPVWPADVGVDPVTRPADDATLHTVLDDAFSEHYRYMPESSEDWARRSLDREDFAPGLSFLVRQGGEAIAAVANYAPGDRGWVGMIGVLRPWRRQGLATALLLQSFHAFRERGMRGAGLGVDSENPRATSVYERLGMRVTQEHNLFEKRLRT